MILCDLGAGTGLFSLAASSITKNDIYALDISDKMIDILIKRKKEGKVSNLNIQKNNDDKINIDDNKCDLVLLATVFHEIDNKNEILKEIKRIKKNNGKLAIIEFHKKETPIGPPVNHRISLDYVKNICLNQGFEHIDDFSLGSNFYTIVFK